MYDDVYCLCGNIRKNTMFFFFFFCFGRLRLLSSISSCSLFVAFFASFRNRTEHPSSDSSQENYAILVGRQSRVPNTYPYNFIQSIQYI